MRYKKVKLGVFLLLGLGLTTIQAQETIPVSGGNASGIGGSASYTVGQIVYTNSSGTNGSVAQGVQQPFEISVETEIEEAKDLNIICMAYPNPTTNFITLKVDDYDKENLSYNLFDITGKLVESKKVVDEETSIIMNKLVSGTFLLKVIKQNKEIKTFKIIKR
jgi:hypothetical protein